jgi:hypothetical protein
MIRGLLIRAAIPSLLLGFAVAAVGCGGNERKTAVVTGKVTYKGKPVPTGTITFVPKTPGPPATGELRPDGTYTLTTYRDGDGAVLGEHTVMITALQDMSDRLPEDRNPLPPPIIPSKYSSVSTSGLTATVEDKENAIDFNLGDK